MPLYIEDTATTQLVTELAARRGISEQAAVELAVRTELDRMGQAVPLRDQFAALRAEHPLPPATGKLADKAFFDALSDNR